MKQVHDQTDAPVIFCDGTFSCGQQNGIVQVTLAVEHYVNMDNGTVAAKHVTAAYLRLTVRAATELHDALTLVLKKPH